MAATSAASAADLSSHGRQVTGEARRDGSAQRPARRTGVAYGRREWPGPSVAAKERSVTPAHAKGELAGRRSRRTVGTSVGRHVGGGGCLLLASVEGRYPYCRGRSKESTSRDIPDQCQAPDHDSCRRASCRWPRGGRTDHCPRRRPWARGVGAREPNTRGVRRSAQRRLRGRRARRPA